MEKSISENGYLKEAKKIYKVAKIELNNSKKIKNSEIKARQSAEKGYLALLKTVDALLLKNKVNADELPNTERGRLYFLRKYSDKDFRRKYSAIRHDLHIDAFHEGIIDFKILDENFEDLESLIKAVERTIN